MSDRNKDNKDFEFIKEQIVEKKHKRIKKVLFPFFTMVIMAVVFGVVAAFTFCLTEPRFLKFLQRDEKERQPIVFPSEIPDTDVEDITITPSITPTPEDVDQPNDSGKEELPGGQASNQPKTVYIERISDIDDYMNMYNEIKTVVAETNKSLVTVSSIKNDEDWFFGGSIELQNQTTGVIIADDGTDYLILVSLDRIKNANAIRVELSDQVAVDAQLRDYEEEMNLAMISVAIKDIPEIFKKSLVVATLGESYTVVVGNPIIALGSPNGHPKSMDLGFVTSKGSTISVTDNRYDLFNTSIADNEDSDGIIINMKGQIVGIITRTLKEGLNENLNTVIGISKLKPLLTKMANQEPRIYFGVKTQDMTEAAKELHKVDNGIYVNEVLPNSPAFNAGLKIGDIILKVNETYILNTSNFNNLISNNQPNTNIYIRIKRTSSTNDKEMDLVVTLVQKDK